jgi:energy-converting hydrogenase Eha subunit G
MSSSLDKRETGSAIRIIGWVLMLFGFLVMFFHPAAVKLGEIHFGLLAIVLAGTGLVLSLIGARIKARNR